MLKPFVLPSGRLPALQGSAGRKSWRVTGRQQHRLDRPIEGASLQARGVAAWKDRRGAGPLMPKPLSPKAVKAHEPPALHRSVPDGYRLLSAHDILCNSVQANVGT